MDSLVRLITDFHVWLNTEPYPESVKDVQRYWNGRRTEYYKKVTKKYIEEVESKKGDKCISIIK